MKRWSTTLLLFASLLFLGSGTLTAQGVTTGAITGVVASDGAPVSGANVIAVHQPSGTRYGAITRDDGRFTIPNMRVGGPYTVNVSHIGFEATERTGVTVNLGVATEVNFGVRERAVEVAGITVTAEGQDAILSPDRTGAATSISSGALRTLPTITRRVEDFARLTPQYSGGPFGFSFAGQDNRLNNMTVDGSYFNNSFGLAGQPGDRTGVSPISLDAIEQVQVNIAPFDVRHGNFVGAGVNTVTRSGTNDFRGSLLYEFRDEGMVGTEAGSNTFNPGTFDFSNIGGWISGPIMQNKLFFFASFETENTEQPGTTWLAARTGVTADNVTRVQATDLDALSTYLSTNFDYETGPYENYPFETPATRFLGKLDFNVNQRNKLSLRYTHLDSETDVLASNSSSLGFGLRRTNPNGLNFANTNYAILENIRSIIGEWNSTIGTNKANNLIVGYTYQDESRSAPGEMFPFVDILQTGSVYTSFGFEPFTPNNELRYKSLQLQNNFSIFGEKHTWTFGLSAERYESENVFFPGSQSAYVYNSLADYYTDANDFLAVCGSDSANWATCSRPTSPVTLRRFQVRWNNIPGQDKPVQPLEVFFGGIYGQDEWQVNDKLKVTLGLRVDAPFFGNTAYQNPLADQLAFRDEDGNSVQYQTGELPDPSPLFSPRIGFNLDAFGDRSTQVRGGTGIFTGRPAYVWISNQIGNTGVLTGFARLDNTTTRPWHPDPDHYKPTDVTGAPATQYELALTDPDFKFPQLWRTNLALDQRLPWGVVGTVEGLYSKDVNGIYYINANLPASNGTVTYASGVTGERWVGGTAATRIHSNVDNAVVLKNQSEGYAWTISAALEKAFSSGLFAKAAYSYGVAKNTVDPGSIAFGSWSGNEVLGDPNNPGLGYSDNSPGHRAFFVASYRKEWFKFGGTTLSLFAEGRTQGNSTYTYNGDINGDGTSFNDLMYIPRDASEMNFVQYTQGASGTTPARTFTVAEQQAAFEQFIQQDDYLSEHRGEFAERGGVFMPMVFRMDLAAEQELFTNIAGKRNAISIRADVQNFGNLLNSDWGIGKSFNTTQPLASAAVAADGTLTYRMRNNNPTGTQHELITETYRPSVGALDVYRFKVSLRYTFN
ncbi:MAG TPA: carboxypeptidase regulatory-like domain-containing protein [Longimicrobiales bacterium]|nr:carboxypeptidase regulatory-like domain-containing protein [Longimicrobiales bacterium]